MNDNSNGMNFNRNRYDTNAAWGTARSEPRWMEVGGGKLAMRQSTANGQNKLQLVMINGKWASMPKPKQSKGQP
jgi:hypothetical protein